MTTKKEVYVLENTRRAEGMVKKKNQGISVSLQLCRQQVTQAQAMQDRIKMLRDLLAPILLNMDSLAPSFFLSNGIADHSSARHRLRRCLRGRDIQGTM